MTAPAARRSSKRAISFPPGVLEAAEHEAGRQHGGNVSAFVSAAVQEKLARDRDRATLADLFGEPDPEVLALVRRRWDIPAQVPSPSEPTA